jgi:hypothetical protein
MSVPAWNGTLLLRLTLVVLGYAGTDRAPTLCQQGGIKYLLLLKKIDNRHCAAPPQEPAIKKNHLN